MEIFWSKTKDRYIYRLDSGEVFAVVRHVGPKKWCMETATMRGHEESLEDAKAEAIRVLSCTKFQITGKLTT